MHTALFDAYSGVLVPAPQFNEGVLYWITRLHTDMLAGLPGKLFLGVMGVLFAIAIVSGVVLYRPFMAKLAFGTVRRERSRRVKWLDLHNLPGIVTRSEAHTSELQSLMRTSYAVFCLKKKKHGKHKKKYQNYQYINTDKQYHNDTNKVNQQSKEELVL